MTEATHARPSLLVFADDWGRHPSSCQHLIRQLLGRYEVVWVNTIGMRTPRLDWATVSRGLEKLRHWTRPRQQTAAPPPAGLRVVSPRMWPWCGSHASRWLNRKMLGRQLTRVIGTMPGEPIAITTLPIVADLVGVLPVRRWVYYCVDDFSQWPGLDQKTLGRLEELLVQKVDTCVAVSETLQGRLRQFGRESHLLTHGVDVEFWRGEGGQGGEVPALKDLPRPLVVFWGVVDRRMDVTFLHRLAADLAGGTIVLIGPWESPDPALLLPGKIIHVPPLPFEQLPLVAREAGVLVMPYADLPVTRAIQPLKMKEYLATGRPVVMRDLPATRPFADCLDLVDTAEAFSAVVRRRLAEGVRDDQARARGRIAGESWAAKAGDLERWALTSEGR